MDLFNKKYILSNGGYNNDKTDDMETTTSIKPIRECIQ